LKEFIKEAESKQKCSDMLPAPPTSREVYVAQSKRGRMEVQQSPS